MKVYDSKEGNNVLHAYAYDVFKNYVKIENALKLSERKYYLDQNLEVEFIPVNFYKIKKQVPHWRTKPDQYLTIDGKKYKYSNDADSESYAHKKKKGDIINDGFFYFNNYKIYITEAKEEYTIDGSIFRSDISCSLLCGYRCTIEVIKTSDLSIKKEKYINENEILTFKIYIDDQGNQIPYRSNYIGAGKIESIKNSIQKGEGILAEFTQYWDVSWDEIDRITTETFFDQILVNDKHRRIIELENEYSRYKNEIREIAENCDVSWFGSQRKNLKGEDKINEIIYYIS
jgi:hypothetical protein